MYEPFDVLWRGRLAPGQVVCRPVAGTFQPDAVARQRIARAWRRAARPGVQLFDGPMCRLERMVRRAGRLVLEISPTSYKAFVGTNMAHGERPPRADPIGLSVALESRDGRLLLGRRNRRVAYYPGHIHPFAGALEPAAEVDVFAEARRELREELGLADGEVWGLELRQVVADRKLRQPELIFLARCRLTAARVARRLDRTEHSALVALTRAQVPAALAGSQRWTPVGAAAALLWLGDAGAKRMIRPNNGPAEATSL
jgi:8-oxo-dGTP pyrophosphatase MutT (NUDIX family)